MNLLESRPVLSAETVNLLHIQEMNNLLLFC
jgi:hypothetical protein